ncbi:MAG: amino acid ABC transporter permease [Propionivibrio sp.]|uniref:amino acid ABC transporter permease n=1 Tax=Propionivibrio sp. TaxID=2212460 RepID=UPI001B7AC41D|nr:amino acid ABC transporter permease [Propionivibrio sp.]MBP7202604.1 amino acid ABC transporter permease [Propionivibrio sp.]
MPSLLTFLLAPSDGRPVERAACVVAWSFVALLTAALFTFAFNQLHYGWNWPAIWAYRQKFVQGWLMTVAISAAALLVSVLIGVVTALARRARFLPLRYAAALYVEAVRGTPLLVQILILFYVVANAVGVENRYVVGVLTLSLFAGAYLAEMVRAGIESIRDSQLESARAIGLTRGQTYRYVIFPQVVRQLIPPLTGQFASIIKDSSLLSIIALNEFTLNAQEVNAFTYSTLESYLPLAAGYLLLTLPISLASRILERKFHYAA